MIPDRGKDPRRVVPLKGDVIGKIQDERLGRMMATREEAHTAGWGVDPSADLRSVGIAHAAGYESPVSGAALSAYRAEKGMKQ